MVETAAALTRSKLKLQISTEGSRQSEDLIQVQAETRRPPAGSAVQNMCNMEHFSDLTQLLKIVAWVWRTAKKFLGRIRTLNNPKWEAVSSGGTISVRKREDALRDILLAAQEGITFPNTTRDRLVVYKDADSGLFAVAECRSLKKIKLSSRSQPYRAWVSTLLARESHGQSHKGLTETLLRIRKAWVIIGKRITQKVRKLCLV